MPALRSAGPERSGEGRESERAELAVNLLGRAAVPLLHPPAEQADEGADNTSAPVAFDNVLLGVNQGLCWSTTVIMKIDLVGPARRGLVMGLNEAAGYVAVALAALGAGYLAATYALRPQPFVLGLVFAVTGLLLSLFFVRESRGHATLEAQQHQGGATAAEQTSFAQILLLTSWKDRALFATSQAGMVNNLNDGMAWGLFPLYFALAGLSIGEVSLLAAIYPAVQGLGQLGTGALSDYLGRKWLIASGMIVQAGGIFVIMLTGGFWPWAGGAALLGLGTAMVYPTLLAVVGMEASALYALATAKGYPIICFAHVTNTMATAGDDFEKGPDQGSRATLAIIAETARIWRAAKPRL